GDSASSMDDDGTQPSTSPDPPASAAQGQELPARKKQKRNKPTLSCEECVERKTKVSPRLLCAVEWSATCIAEQRSATAAGPIAWPASSGSRHASTRTLQTSLHRRRTSELGDQRRLRLSSTAAAAAKQWHRVGAV